MRFCIQQTTSITWQQAVRFSPMGPHVLEGFEITLQREILTCHVFGPHQIWEFLTDWLCNPSQLILRGTTDFAYKRMRRIIGKRKKEIYCYPAEIPLQPYPVCPNPPIYFPHTELSPSPFSSSIDHQPTSIRLSTILRLSVSFPSSSQTHKTHRSTTQLSPPSLQPEISSPPYLYDTSLHLH